jgi:HD-GYP domain-containing protein (c-di-GMP phosphodiesterase class II)
MRLMADERIQRQGRFGSRDTSSEGSPDEIAYASMVLERLARHTCRIAGVDWSCLFVLDRYDPRLAIVAAGCGVPWELIGTRVGADEGVVGAVLQAGEPALLDDHRRLIGQLAIEDDVGRPGAALPIRFGGSVGGVLCAAITRGRPGFEPQDMEVLAELADLAGAALDHGRKHRHYDATVRAHVDALAAAMDMRDQRTARHSEDVVHLARQVGMLLELEPASLMELEFAARLHDVGKIQVPDAVLNKPGPLEPHENEVIRCHAAWGSETLSRIPGLEAVATIVRFHHERWDGAGYPDGLSGARIPLASRIISACDAYGAMTADRPYRSALDPGEALGEIRQGSGTQFDPSVVRALVDTLAAAV